MSTNDIFITQSSLATLIQQRVDLGDTYWEALNDIVAEKQLDVTRIKKLLSKDIIQKLTVELSRKKMVKSTNADPEIDSMETCADESGNQQSTISV